MGEFAGYLLSNLPSLAVVAGVYFLIKRQLSDSRAAQGQLEMSSSTQANEIHLIKKDKRELRKDIDMLREEITNERSRRADEIAHIASKDGFGAERLATLEQQVGELAGAEQIARLEQQVSELAGLVKKHGELSGAFDGMSEKLEGLGASVTELVDKVAAREGREEAMIGEIDEKLRRFAAERVRYLETLRAAEDKEIEGLASLLHAQRGGGGD